MEQPELIIQEKYRELCAREKELLDLGGGKKPIRIGWLHPYTSERLDKYVLEVELEDPKNEIEKRLFVKKSNRLAAKAASCVILNNFFKIVFFHWFHWRWLYYIREYNNFQYAMIIIEGQKKSPPDPYLTAIQFLKMGKMTKRMMTAKEAAQSPAGQDSVQ